MSESENVIDRELFLEKFEKMSLKIEQLALEISKMKEKLDKSNKINRSFGLKAIRNSKPLTFTKEIYGLRSPTKQYVLSIRTVSEVWKGRKNYFLITIRQQESETHMDLKALGIRIPIDDMKNLTTLAKEVLSLLYISRELKGIQVTEILREIVSEINKDGQSMVREIKQNMMIQ